MEPVSWAVAGTILTLVKAPFSDSHPGTRIVRSKPLLRVPLPKTNMLTPDIVSQLRRQFPALYRVVNGKTAVYLDGPAGTQVPRRVIDAISRYLEQCNANHGGLFPTSRDSDASLDQCIAGWRISSAGRIRTRSRSAPT